jgi:hypothetical protein
MSAGLRTLSLNDDWIFCARRRQEMIFSKNVSSAVHALTLCQVACQQAGQDRARTGGDFIWEEEGIAQDLFVHLVDNSCVWKRR